MVLIKVINKGHNDTILCDYNGQRYSFPKGKPIEISSEVYNFIMRSGSVDAMDLQFYQEIAAEEKQENIPEFPNKNIVEEKKAKSIKKFGGKK